MDKNLDPRAQEFIPTNYTLSSSCSSSSLFLLSSPLYFSYSLPPPPPPPPPPPAVIFKPQPAYNFSTAHVPILPPARPQQPPPPSMAVIMPSRALLVSMLPGDVSESTIRRDLELFGDVRAVQMERVRSDGIVTVHFYDVRQSRRALEEIQEQNLLQQHRLRHHYDELLIAAARIGINRNIPPPVPSPAPGLVAGRAVWAEFTAPSVCSMPDGNNQGTLVIFNLDPQLPSCILKKIFQAFGHVKELRETPMKMHQRFVEFYDTRDAALAMAEMNGKEMSGKRIVIEYSRPGGHSGRLMPDTTSSIMPPRMSTMFGGGCPPPAPGFRGKTTKKNGGGGGGGGGRSWTSSLNSCKKNCVVVTGSVTTASKPRGGGGRGVGGGGARPWKGGNKLREYDPRFFINEEAIMESNCRDSRTTLMIKNIPNKYSLKLLLDMLDNHCIKCNGDNIAEDEQPLSSYDFVYLPIDFINKCNVGYGFVNMTSPGATLRIYKAFHRQNWEVFNSRKVCHVTYARLQGLEALKEHFKKSKFLCEADEYMPMIFSPPRDGRQLTEPVPICCRCRSSSSSSSSSMSPPLRKSSSVGSKDDEEISRGDRFQEDDVEGEEERKKNQLVKLMHGSPNGSTDKVM